MTQDLNQTTQPALSIAQIVKVLSQDQVLCKEPPDDENIYKIPKNIPISKFQVNYRVLIKNSTEIVDVLPQSVSSQVKSLQVTKASDLTYDNIGGVDKQIKELREIVELPLKNPQLYKNLGISSSGGVILHGAPGCGKSLLARIVASQCGCSFISISASELVSKYIGEGASKVREIFQLAKQEAPSILFIDEIDSLPSRTSSADGAEQEVQRTMMELLVQMDSFKSDSRVKVIMATNRIDMLDKALLRPGRLDRIIEIPRPNEEARIQILKIHSNKMNLKDINFKQISQEMIDASGADCETVCNEAGIMALRDKRQCVRQEDFLEAVKKVMNKNYVKAEDVMYVM